VVTSPLTTTNTSDPTVLTVVAVSNPQMNTLTISSNKKSVQLSIDKATITSFIKVLRRRVKMRKTRRKAIECSSMRRRPVHPHQE